MNITDLLREDGVVLKKVAGTHGGEFASRCPQCGGTDRFRAWPNEGNGGKWWCRQCDKGVDVLEYLMKVRGIRYNDACLQLGIEPLKCRTLSWDHRKGANSWTPKEAREPNDSWRAKAALLIDWAVDQLHWTEDGMEALEWLQTERGLTEQTIKDSRLGWIPKDFRKDRAEWGLPESKRENGTPRPLWIPRGLLIPYLLDDVPLKLKVRRPDPNAEPRYYLLPGSSPRAMIFRLDRPVSLVVESELDALLIDQEAGDLVNSVALGSAKMRPDAAAVRVIEKSARILNALDCDQAGACESWTWWREQFANAHRWPPVVGKDPGDMRASGVSIRAWVEAGLPAAETADSSTESVDLSSKPADVSTSGVERKSVMAELYRFYAITAENYKAPDWARLIEIPGWKDALDRLEESFTLAWQSGENSSREFEELREHWRAGMGVVKGVRRAA
jgi:DNA primase